MRQPISQYIFYCPGLCMAFTLELIMSSWICKQTKKKKKKVKMLGLVLSQNNTYLVNTFTQHISANITAGGLCGNSSWKWRNKPCAVMWIIYMSFIVLAILDFDRQYFLAISICCFFNVGFVTLRTKGYCLLNLLSSTLEWSRFTVAMAPGSLIYPVHCFETEVVMWSHARQTCMLQRRFWSVRRMCSRPTAQKNYALSQGTIP